MAGMVSCGESAGGNSATISGIRSLSYGIRLRGRRRQAGHGRDITTGDCSVRSFHGGLNLPLAGIYIQLRNFGLDLGFELVAGAFELVERFTYLPPNLRQFLRPEDDQGDHEDKNHLWQAEIHAYIILRRRTVSNEQHGRPANIFRGVGERRAFAAESRILSTKGALL